MKKERLVKKEDLQNLFITDLIKTAEDYDLDNVDLRELTYDQLVELIVDSRLHYVVEW